MDNSRKINQLEKDKSKAKQKKNYQEVISCCNTLGGLYAENDNFDQAIIQHKEELDYARILNDDLSIAVANRKLGECYSELSEFENALKFQNRYLSIVTKLNDTVEIQRAWATLGRTYFMQHLNDSKRYSDALSKAETAHSKSLSLIERLEDNLSDKDLNQMRCRVNLNLGLVYDQKDDLEKSRSFFERAINLAHKCDSKEDLHRCEISLAAFYLKSSNLTGAIKMYGSAFESAKQLDSKLDQFDALMGKGHAYVQKLDYESARNCFKRAYHLYDHDCDENYEAKRCWNIIKDVIINIRELINLKSDENEKKIKINDKLGDLFASLNCYSIALNYYNDELMLALNENYDKDKLAPIYLSLGQTYLDNEQFTEALYNFRKEIECNQGKPKEEILTSLKIIETKCALHRNNEEIIDEFNRLIKNFCVNNQLKKLVYKEYLNFLKEIDENELYSDLIKQIKTKLNKLNMENDTDQQFNSQMSENSQQSSATDQQKDDVLDDVSDLTSDSENEELNERRTKRKRNSDERRNEKGETQLHQACIKGNLKQVENYIEKGHKINTRDNAGWLPIHEAANHGYTEIVDLLIKHKALINDRGGDRCKGVTPIHDACTNGHISVIRLLLGAGANVCCEDDNGNTPLDCLKDFLKRSIDDLSDLDRKDFQLLVNELKDEMIKKGYDEKRFNEKKTLKRSRSFLNDELDEDLDQHSNLLEELSNKIDRNRSKRSTLDSPPRKTNRINQSNSSSHTNDLRKDTDHSSKNQLNRFKPSRIDALIDEDNLVIDDFIEDDIGLNHKRQQLTTDPFESNRTINNNKITKKKRQSNENKSPFKQSTSNQHLISSAGDDDSLINCNFESDIEMDNDCLEISSNLAETNVNFSKKIKRKQTKINSYFNSDEQTLKSNDEKGDDVILMNNNVVGKRNLSSNVIQNQTNKPIVNSKLKVHVHIDDMILLVPIPNENVLIGWLANETIERYYSFKKIRPVIQLKTMDGALLSNDDQIVDVLTKMEVKVEIDSFNIKPINELYNELCKSNNIKIVSELDYEFRISMASGCLNLRNCFLDERQIRLVSNSLRMQSKIRVLDLSYSNLMKLDDNCKFIEIILTNLTNLETLNLECTGFSRQHLIEITKHKSTKLQNLNLNYNLLFNCVDIICDLIESNINLSKLFLQYTDLTEQLILNLRLNQLIEKRSNLKIHIDTLKNSKNFYSSSFIASSLDLPETNEIDHSEFTKKLFIT